MLVTTTLSFPSLAAEAVECEKPCAKTCVKPCEAPKYFYFGAKAGIAGVNGKYQALDSSVGNLHSARIGGTSGQFGLVLGANTFFANYFYTGLELDGYYDTYDHNVRVSSSSTGVKNHVASVKTKFRFGFSGRLGIKIMQSIPYVLVGGDIGRWTMKLGNDSNTTNRGIAGNSHTNYNKTQVRPKIGAGIQIPLCDSLSARLEYAYLFGPTIKKTLTDSIAAINWNHKTKINQQSVNVVVIYNF